MDAEQLVVPGPEDGPHDSAVIGFGHGPGVETVRSLSDRDLVVDGGYAGAGRLSLHKWSINLFINSVLWTIALSNGKKVPY